jgi:hypothetical protein
VITSSSASFPFFNNPETCGDHALSFCSAYCTLRYELI